MVHCSYILNHHSIHYQRLRTVLKAPNISRRIAHSLLVVFIKSTSKLSANFGDVCDRQKQCFLSFGDRQLYPVQLYPARSFHLAVFEWSINCFFFVIYFCTCNISIFVGKIRCQKLFPPACVCTACLTRSYHGFIVVCVIRSRNASSPSKPLNTPYTAWKEQNSRRIISIDWRKMDKDKWPCGIHCLSSYSNYTKSFTKSARFGALPPMNFLLPTAFIHFSASSYMASRTLFLILYLKRKTSHWFKG